METRDIDIRRKLHIQFNKNYSRDIDTLIVDELGLCQGDARIDVAIINGIMHGYEIKSEKDTLVRLPNQIKVYSRVMDKMTLVTSEKFVKESINMIPDWWGIKVIVHTSRSFKIKTIKRCKINKNVDPYSVAQLLWRNEAVEILEKNNLIKGIKSQPKRVLWEKLANCIPIDELKLEVREALKSRKGWRADL